MSGLEFRVLGPVEIRRDGVPLRLDGSKQRTVLTALLIAGNQVLPDARISEYLWGEHPPCTFNAQIYTYISCLRKILGGTVHITRRSPGYLFQPGTSWFDFAEFEELAARGRSALLAGRYEESSALLRSALQLWRGPAFADVSEYLLAIEGPRMEEAWLAATENRVEADLALGRHAELLPELTGLVRRYPLQERFRAQLMTTYYRCDRQADALVLYEEGRRILADELGVDPGDRLRDAHRSILAADAGLGARQAS